MQDNTMVLGVTHRCARGYVARVQIQCRYKKKYITTVLYKPFEASF